MTKTSLTHPLQIAAVSAGPRFGESGSRSAQANMTRARRPERGNRDLAVDLESIRDWGAAAVVTLLEPRKLNLLRMKYLGEEVLRRKMLWFHLPTIDASIPDEEF